MKLLPWIVTVVIVTILAAGSYALKGSIIAARAQSSSEQAATVEAMRVKTEAHQPYIEISGVLKAPQTIALVNEVPGKITKVHFASGDLVEAGSVLVEINHTEELAQLKSAKARVKQQHNTVARFKRLNKLGKLSEQQLEEAATLLSQYRADVDLLQAKIDKKVITAPFTAYVGIHDLQVGQYLAANTELTQMVGLQQHMWVDFSVPQTYEELAMNTPIRVSLIGNDNSEQLAYINSVESEVSANTRQLKYRARIARNEELYANQLVKVRLPIGDVQQVISVPAMAIIKDQLGNYVYLLQEDAQGVLRAQRQQVELGERIADRVMIVKGLQGNPMIASSGAFKLRNGLKTFIAQPQQESVAMEETQQRGVSL